jgi:hypothetical protein
MISLKKYLNQDHLTKIGFDKKIKNCFLVSLQQSGASKFKKCRGKKYNFIKNLIQML